MKKSARVIPFRGKRHRARLRRGKLTAFVVDLTELEARAMVTSVFDQTTEKHKAVQRTLKKLRRQIRMRLDDS